MAKSHPKRQFLQEAGALHLHPERVLAKPFQRDRFDGFVFSIAHQSGKIGQAQTLVLNTAKTVMKKLVEIYKLFSKQFSIS